MELRVTYDKDVDAAYIYLRDIADGEAVKQISVSNQIILDIDREGRLIGIEVLRASATLPKSVIMAAEPPLDHEDEDNS